MSAWPGPFATYTTFPNRASPYIGLVTNPLVPNSNYVAISLVTPATFGYYQLSGNSVNNQIQVDPEPVPIGR